MIKPIATDARELIDLAERMGIPPEDAVRRVVRQLTELRRPEERSEADALGVGVTTPAVTSQP